jgi:hypothetical protein
LKLPPNTNVKGICVKPALAAAVATVLGAEAALEPPVPPPVAIELNCTCLSFVA